MRLLLEYLGAVMPGMRRCRQRAFANSAEISLIKRALGFPFLWSIASGYRVFTWR